MQEFVHTPLNVWENFYVIVGSAGAALTGLQFVVIAIAADSPHRGTGQDISAFGTPTVVHFCAVLLLAAIISAPWQQMLNVSIALGSTGLIGLIYCFIVTRRAFKTGYKPVFEDWLFHAILPTISYGSVLLSSLFLLSNPPRVLFVFGVASLLLLFIGIHNAWDTVTFLAISQNKKANKDTKESKDEGN